MAGVYEGVDPTLRGWVRSKGFKLLTEFSGEARFFYVSGGPQECFQIWLDHPLEGQVMIHAGTIETIDGAEMHGVWCVAEEDIGAALDTALAQIRDWMNRPKGPATWTPHWES